MTEPAYSSTLPNGVPVVGVPRVDGLVAQLITDPNARERLTSTRLVDTRTALARGLVEYFGQLVFLADGGRQMSFVNAQLTWAEPEVQAEAPAYVVTALSAGDYADADFTPRVHDLGQRRGLVEFGALEQTFRMGVWAKDPHQRMGLVTAIEDASDPVEWMSGFRLELPYYFGARATYAVRNVIYEDSAPTAQRRWRAAAFDVLASVPKYRPIGTPPTLIPELAVEVT